MKYEDWTETELREYEMLLERRAAIPTVRPGDLIDAFFSHNKSSIIGAKVIMVEDRPGMCPAVTLDMQDPSPIFSGKHHKMHFDASYITKVYPMGIIPPYPNPHRRHRYYFGRQTNRVFFGNILMLAFDILETASYPVPGVLDEDKLLERYAKDRNPGMKSRLHGMMEVNCKVFKKWLRRNVSRLCKASSSRESDLHSIRISLEYEADYFRELDREMEESYPDPQDEPY